MSTEATKQTSRDEVSIVRLLALGAAGGILGAGAAGILEALVVLATSEGDFSWGLVFLALGFYAINGALFGPVVGVLAAAARRRRGARVWADAAASLFALGVSSITFYKVWQLVLESTTAQIPVLALGCVALAGVVFLAASSTVDRLSRRPKVHLLMRPTGALLAVLALMVLGRASLSVGNSTSAGAAPTAAAHSQTSPNVLLIVVDTLRADRLPSYGYSAGVTPHLDRFAADAVRYDQYFVNSSWTRPSMASIFTGQPPATHGVMFPNQALPDELETLAERMHAGGYRTSGLVANYNMGPHFNYGQGFEEYTFVDPDVVVGSGQGLGGRVSTKTASAFIGADIMSMGELLPLRLYQRFFSLFSSAAGDVSSGTVYQDAATVNHRAFNWLANAPSSPWFLFLNYMDPHHPYYRHPYDGTAFTRAAHEFPSKEDVELLQNLYDGEITYWDEHFGALIAELKRAGTYDDMLIVVTSDHGEEIGDHGGFYHGTTVYDEVVHVPLYFKLPKNKRAGETVAHWAQSIGLMGSILDVAGLPAAAAAQQHPIDVASSVIRAEENHEGHDLESVRAVWQGEPWLLIQANPDNPRGLEPVELYRLREDPKQLHNVAARFPDAVQALTKLVRETRDNLASAVPPSREVELTQDDRERLCALGYLDCD